MFERPGRGNKNGLHLLRELGQASCKFWPKPIRTTDEDGGGFCVDVELLE